MLHNKRLNKIEKEISPHQKYARILYTHIKGEFNLKIAWEELTKDKTNLIPYEEFQLMDVIIHNIYLNFNNKDFQFDTITTTGENEETMLRRYPKAYKRYLQIKSESLKKLEKLNLSYNEKHGKFKS